MQEYDHEFKDVLYRTPTELERSGGLWPVRIGRNAAKPKYAVEPRMIPYYSLHFVLQGSIRLTHSGRQFLLHQGDVFCLFPDTLHHYSVPEAGAQLRMFWIAMEGEQVPRLMERNRLSQEWPVGRRAFPSSLEPLLLELMDVYKSSLTGANDDDIRSLGLIYRIFASLTLTGGAEASGLQEELTYSHWVQRSKQFMELHYTEAISVADIAAYASVHRTQLHRLFVKQFGLSPIHYLQKLRLEKGSRLLLETNCTITEIALSVGYPDPCSFSRAYRKFYGASPSELRRRQKLS